LTAIDIQAGRGVGLIDPHGDLVHDLFRHLLSDGYFTQPEHFDRVIYFDPAHPKYTIPFNVLINVLKINRQPHHLADQIIDSFRRAWPTIQNGAPMFKDVAKPALMALIATGQTLVDLREFLRNKAYRDGLISKIKDADLAAEIQKDFGKVDKESIPDSNSVRNKLTDFAYDADVKAAFGATINRLDFGKIMDEGKVLIVNLSNCGDETRPLFASMVALGFEKAAKHQRQTRRPFYLYLDECQSYFANEGSAKVLLEVLSECRKFALHLTLVHQQMSQLPAEVRDALGNTGVKVAFNSAHKDAREMVYELCVPESHATEIRVAAARFQRLAKRTAFIKVDGWNMKRFVTNPIKPYTATVEDLVKLIDALLQKHGVERQQAKTIPLPRQAATFARPRDW
jgi:type IV secretory pathway TraG/TraD family ATPase VirD4